jgi:hypothetical protein
MDPYLEGSLWTSVHTQLSVEIARQLSPLLAPKYVARTPKRFFIETGEDEDDVSVGIVTIEIRDVKYRQLVTAIEVFSPSNKSGDDRDEYLEWRQRFLLDTAHLIEIDLLREGQRVPMRESLPNAPYLVFLSRASRRPVMDVWPIQLRERLPFIPVPLLDGDVDIGLDLQEAFNTVYEQFNYHLDAGYLRPPHVALSVTDMEWAQNRVAAWKREGGGR